MTKRALRLSLPALICLVVPLFSLLFSGDLGATEDVTPGGRRTADVIIGTKPVHDFGSRCAEGREWEVVFFDDFNGTEVDQTLWEPYYSPGHNGNGLRRPEAITVEDGNLVITAEMKDGLVVSGGMQTVLIQQYGKFEARVRTEANPVGHLSGVILTWPAFNTYPENGENDFYETGEGREPFFTFIHYPDISHERLVHHADATEWHEIRMDWSAEEIAIYRDQEYAGSIVDLDAIPDAPHYLTVQLDAFTPAMGPDPVKMYVDWVRISRPKPSGPCP